MQVDILRNVRSVALDLGVYLPLGAALAARDLILDLDRLGGLYGDLVARGREGLGFVRQPRQRLERVSLDLGDAALELSERLEERADDLRDGDRAPAEERGAPSAAEEPRPPATAESAGRIAPPTAAVLPIEEYEDLTAAQVVARLGGLTQDDLSRIRAYERANRNRATVLQAIEPQLGELPIQGYDRMTANQVVRRLADLSNEELRRVGDYEARTKARRTVLDRIDSLGGA